LLDSPGFDFCNIKSPDKVYSYINHSDIILFIVSGDLNRNELSEISSLIKDGKKIIVTLNKIDLFNKIELKEIILMKLLMETKLNCLKIRMDLLLLKY